MTNSYVISRNDCTDFTTDDELAIKLIDDNNIEVIEKVQMIRS
jgi:hypothetical protein